MARKAQPTPIDTDEVDELPARPPARKRRKCLMCNQPFDSEGAHNRICRRCKSSQAWRGA